MQRLMFTSVVIALSAGLSWSQAATPVQHKHGIRTNYGAAGGMKLDPTITGGTSKPNAAKDCATGQQTGSAQSSAPGQATVDAKGAAPGQMEKTAARC
ncbi:MULTISPECIES: hypothetical protein [Mesorhizobium]|uniref:hypothetical protein n=1 Tax=Mesorhizobium TaxID=68287 RepID=UPI0010A96F08|nr:MULTISPECIES: hypothetical protein [Mesorhizobium]